MTNKRAPLPGAKAPTADLSQIGVAGLRVFGGYVDEEFLLELRGDRGRRKFREMADNDATIGAILWGIGVLLRSVKWHAEPATDPNTDAVSEEAQAEADFVDSIFDDMSHSWEDFIGEVLSILTFGWAYHEMVLKRRVGPDQTDPTQRSRFTDGRIGIRKLAPRAQESLMRWEMQDDGGIDGMWQLPPQGVGGPERFIEITRALLFRTVSRKNNPEGVSILRNAYKSWYFLDRISQSEAIGIERELAGLPVVRIPGRYLAADATAADVAVRQQYVKLARDMRFNEQGGVVLPSDVWTDVEGKPIDKYKVDVSLLSSSGQRTIDTVAVKKEYKADIARTVLADFILLGSTTGGHGSYALGQGKIDLFVKCCETVLAQIAAPINRILLPRLWRYNGLNPEAMPTYTPGRIAPANLEALGKFLSDVSGAGAPLFPDPDLENYVREEADLPAKSAEAIALQDEARQQQADAAAAATAAQQAQAEARAVAGGDQNAPQGNLGA